MQENRNSFSKKIAIASIITMTTAGLGGIYLGEKYLNKSQHEFNVLKNENEKIVGKLNNKIIENKNLLNIIESKDGKISELESWKDRKSFVMINKALLSKNLKNYSKLSEANRKIILDSIISESTKYNINPLLLYSLIHVESSMRFWVQHTPVKITINKKRKVIRAVGLGGVVWEWWGKSLIKAGIAEVRSDLFDPEINIKASAFILNEFRKRPKLKGTTSKDESMLRRYFGGNFKSYNNKIDRKVMSIIRTNIYR